MHQNVLGVCDHLMNGVGTNSFFKALGRTIYGILVHWCPDAGSSSWRKPSATKEEEHLTYHSADTLCGADDVGHLFPLLLLPEHHKLLFFLKHSSSTLFSSKLLWGKEYVQLDKVEDKQLARSFYPRNWLQSSDGSWKPMGNFSED